MAARLRGYQGDRAVLYAAVVEFIHTATLVHDDIIDDSELRRGRLAVHSRWGNDITVLLGDYLYIKSMALALTHDTLDLVRLLCDVTLQMIEGELYQLTKNGDADITEDEHFDIIRRKTAYLFGGCGQIGGMLGKVATEQRAGAAEYGFNLGIAFQLVDDLLDFTGDAGGARQADWRRPARRQDDAAAHPPPAAGRTTARRAHRPRHHRLATVDRGTVERAAAHPEQHRSIDYAYRRAVEYAERAKKPLTLPAELRARRPAGAAGLRRLARSIGSVFFHHEGHNASWLRSPRRARSA